jgi:hypothetical protein
MNDVFIRRHFRRKIIIKLVAVSPFTTPVEDNGKIYFSDEYCSEDLSVLLMGYIGLAANAYMIKSDYSAIIRQCVKYENTGAWSFEL